jgi:hypothetical protein
VTRGLQVLVGTLTCLNLTGCASQISITRAYPEDPPQYVELLGADGPAVWARAHEVLKRAGLIIEKERLENGDGYIFCKAFSIDVPGTINQDEFSPGEIVMSSKNEQVTLQHSLEVHLSASATGLVRLWIEGDVHASGHAASDVRVPDLAGYELLQQIVQPLAVVKQWRRERPEAKRVVLGGR